MSNDGNDTPAKPAAPEASKLETADVQQARNASGQSMAITEGLRTNASDGSLRDRSRLIADQEESIQIMGLGGRVASRLSRLSEGDLDGKDQGADNIGVQEASAKAGKEPKAPVEQSGERGNKQPGAGRDAIQLQAQQLADKGDGQGEFAGQAGLPGAHAQGGKIQIGGRFYDRNQLIASNDAQSDVLSDATNAGIFENDKDKIVAKPYEQPNPHLIRSGLDYNTEPVPLSQKIVAFASSAEARLLDPEGRKAYFQGMVDEIAGVGEGLNIAKNEVKESTRIAAEKAWTALKDGSVANFIMQ